MILKTLWNGKESLEINHIDQTLPESFHEIMEYGILASPEDPFDPMEKSIKEMGDQLLDKTEHLHPEWKLSREYQISNELLAVSYAWKGEGEKEEKKGYIIGAKGATEAIIDLCHLPKDSAKFIEAEMLRMASEGVRVLAVARSFSTTLPENQHDLNFEFLGLVGFEDPIRSDVKAAIQECQEAGIKVLMITGDHPATAESIARQIGLSKADKTLTGKEVQALDDNSLKDKLKNVQIFCRMKPLDKLRIVTLLQSSGEVVAMTGDGVNDAPALKKAQIGIAMGKRGTDVAREASSVVLLDDSFSSIVASIKIGRRIFENLQEAFSYLLAIHIPITVLSIIPVLFKLPLILLPVHIAFLHLIIEPASTTLFEALPEGADIMKKKPRPSNLQLISKGEILRSLASGIIISISVIGIFSLALHRGLKPTEARGITFTTLIISNLFLIFILRGKRKAKENQNHLTLLTLATLGLLGIVLYVPFFRELFRFEFLHIHDLLPSLFVSLIAGVVTYYVYRSSRVIERI